MRLNDLTKQSFEIAKSKGWHDSDAPRATLGDRVALILSELSEALEEYRKGKAPTEIYFAGVTEVCAIGDVLKYAAQGHKPEGIGIELADVVIRVGDSAGRYEWDLEAALHHCYVALRDGPEFHPITLARLLDTAPQWPKLHVDMSFGEWICEVARPFLKAEAYGASPTGSINHEFVTEGMATGVWMACQMARRYEIDLEGAIEIKAAFNQTRPFRHGNKKI